ncbi:MAG: hypothetical protein ABW321_30235 [Polyangiales bacterium]
MTRAWLRLAGVLGCLSTSGCMLVATKSDYADYRAVRMAPDPSTRAIAMQEYVDRHPSGHWHDEVESSRKRQELKIFESGKDTRMGLEHYLQAYPDGHFVSQARSRLQAVALIERQEREARDQAKQLAKTRQSRAEELRRTWVGRFLGYWVKTLTELHGWGEPIPDVARQNPQFSRAFGAQPRPRCTQDECVKYYNSEFALPVPGGNRLERKLSLLLRLRMKAGKLERAELLLPDRGFSRWFEFETRRPVASGDRAARLAAIDWALERALPSITTLGDGALFAQAAATVPPTAAALPAVEAPAIGPTGELLDTSIESPTDPQNRVEVEDNAGIGVQGNKAPQELGDLVKQKPDAPAADMKIEAVGVGKRGQRVEVQQAPAPAADTGAATEMLFTAPLEVPKSGSAGAEASVSGAADSPAAPNDEPIKPVVRELFGAGLRVVLFAAGSETHGYDGFVIERATGKQKLGVKPPARPLAPPPSAAAGAAAAPKVAAPGGSAAAAPAAAPAPAAKQPAASPAAPVPAPKPSASTPAPAPKPSAPTPAPAPTTPPSPSAPAGANPAVPPATGPSTP